MPIEHFEGGVAFTGSAVDYYRMTVLKHAVSLEIKGIKLRRGPVIWKLIAREFKIKGNRQAVYDWLCKKVEEMKAEQEHIEK